MLRSNLFFKRSFSALAQRQALPAALVRHTSRVSPWQRNFGSSSVTRGSSVSTTVNADGVALVTLDLADSKVNVLNRTISTELNEALEAAECKLWRETK